MEVDGGVKDVRDASEVMQVAPDSDQPVMEVEVGVKDGQDSYGVYSPVGVAWALGPA